MRCRCDSQDRREQHDARPPFASRALHRVSHADAGVHRAIDTEGREDLRRWGHAGAQDRRRKAVESQGRIAAQIAVQAPSHPPEARAQHAARTEEWQSQQEQDMCELMAKLPGVDFASRLHHAIFGFAENIEGALGKQIQREGQACQTIRQDAVADVAAGREIAGQRRGLLPCLASATRVLVVAIGERLAAGDPQALPQKQQQESGGDALRKVETETAKAGKPVGH